MHVHGAAAVGVGFRDELDDHNVVRSGLRMVIESEGHEVVGEAGLGEKAIRMLDELFAGSEGSRPTVVLMDLMMEGVGGSRRRGGGFRRRTSCRRRACGPGRT